MRELNKVLQKMLEGVDYPFLIEFLEEPSKRIRSRLAILYLKTSNKEINDDIYNILAAGELIHNASLLHDDVIDDADSRRGKTPVAKSISHKISILAGDYLISLAISKLLKLNNQRILDIFQNCMTRMCKAEFGQYFMRGQIPSVEAYLDISKGKTGALFSAILESCAIIVGASIYNAQKFGEVYGLFFQIKNDLDERSVIEDKQNGIYTANSVLGIEKTLSLLDNLKEEMKNLLGAFPESSYKQELEGLFEL